METIPLEALTKFHERPGQSWWLVPMSDVLRTFGEGSGAVYGYDRFRKLVAQVDAERRQAAALRPAAGCPFDPHYDVALGLSLIRPDARQEAEPRTVADPDLTADELRAVVTEVLHRLSQGYQRELQALADAQGLHVNGEALERHARRAACGAVAMTVDAFRSVDRDADAADPCSSNNSP